MPVVAPKLHRRWMLPKTGFRARDEKNGSTEKRRFPLQQKMERYQWKSVRRGTSPTSPGCHRSLERGSKTGKREYIKRLLKNPLPDTRCRRSWSWSQVTVPSPSGSRDSPALAAAMRPQPSRPGMRGGGRTGHAQGGAADALLCSTWRARAPRSPLTGRRCGAAASLLDPVAAPRGRNGGCGRERGAIGANGEGGPRAGLPPAMLMSNGRRRPAAPRARASAAPANRRRYAEMALWPLANRSAGGEGLAPAGRCDAKGGAALLR